jgi:hypothetical protein
MLEHHWLQGRKKACNPAFPDGTYLGCQPYFFNHAWESSPVTLFYDGHIEQLGARDAVRMNARVVMQTGGTTGHGLWSKDCTGMTAPSYPMDDGTYVTGGYYMGQGISSDWTSTSYHILTIDGIRGRDKSAD